MCAMPSPHQFPRSFADVVHEAALDERPGCVFEERDERRQLTRGELAQAALARGAVFTARGLRRGDRLALVVPDTREFIVSFLGAISLGAVPVPLYPPLALGQLDVYTKNTAAILRSAKASRLLCPRMLQPLLSSLLGLAPSLRRLWSIEDLDEDPDTLASRPEVEADDTAFLQFTSGSTGRPKGVRVTHASLLANCRGIMTTGLRINSDERTGDLGVSWLPMYHDMGLIGFALAPFLYAARVVFIPTLRFVKRPQIWMETIDRYRGTITFAPNFALSLVRRKTPTDAVERLDLSCLRVVGCGAEPIDAATVRRFLKHFEPAGLAPSSILACYGLAEATLAVTFADLKKPPRSLRIRAREYREEGRVETASDTFEQGALKFISCGRPFPGHAVTIESERGVDLPPGRVGEIVFRGPSVAGGYYHSPSETARTFTERGLRTGDLGFLADGELFVTGRRKDLRVIRGRNYDPQGIEWCAAEIPGVRQGNTVAFTVPGSETEQLVIVAESRHEDTETVGRKVREQVQREFSLEVADVALLAPGLLPKTSSGKIRRAETRRQYLAGTLGGDGTRGTGHRASVIAVSRHIVFSAAERIRHGFSGRSRSSEPADGGDL